VQFEVSASRVQGNRIRKRQHRESVVKNMTHSHQSSGMTTCATTGGFSKSKFVLFILVLITLVLSASALNSKSSTQRRANRRSLPTRLAVSVNPFEGTPADPRPPLQPTAFNLAGRKQLGGVAQRLQLDPLASQAAWERAFSAFVAEHAATLAARAYG
ncbi:unnamed protein product, partial [Heterosigma akashiwo]